MAQIYQNLTPDQITQLEFQAGKEATKIIDEILSSKLDVQYDASDNGKIPQVNAEGKIELMESSEGLTIDSTLSVEDSAADAKAAGDAIKAIQDVIAPTFSTSYDYAVGQYVYHDSKLYRFTSAHTAGDWDSSEVEVISLSAGADEENASLSELDKRINSLHALVNYGYDTPYKGTTGVLSVERNKTILKMNGTFAASSTAIRLQLNSVNEPKAGTQSSSLGPGFTGFTNGHTYRLRMHVLSGTATQANKVAWAIATGIQPISGTEAITDPVTGDVYTDITYDSTTYSDGLRALLFITRATTGNTLTNWTVEFTIEDLTVSKFAALETRVETIEAKLDYLELTEQIDLSEMGD